MNICYGIETMVCHKLANPSEKEQWAEMKEIDQNA
jgi:hypothetical protein